VKWPDKDVVVPQEPPPKREKKKRGLSVQEREEVVQKVCSQAVAPPAQKHAQPRRAAKQVAQLYSQKHALYHRHRATSWQRAIENRGVLGCCAKVVAQADVLQVEVEDYVEAQFWWFDTAFGRAPSYKELAGPKATYRWKAWRVARVHGEAHQKTVHVATGGTFNPQDTSVADELEAELKTLERLVRQWGSEEEVWRLMGDQGVFSDAFMQTRPLWVKMTEK